MRKKQDLAVEMNRVGKWLISQLCQIIEIIMAHNFMMYTAVSNHKTYTNHMVYINTYNETYIDINTFMAKVIIFNCKIQQFQKKKHFF